MNFRKFGWMVVLLGVIFGAVAAYHFSIPEIYKEQELNAIIESAKYNQFTSEYIGLQSRFAEAKKMGMWFGIACGITCFLGLAVVFSGISRESGLVEAEGQPTSDGTDTPANVRKCPFCAETVKSEAKICRHCQRDLPSAMSEAGT